MNENQAFELQSNFNPEDKANEEMSALVDNNIPYVSKRRGQKTKEKEGLMT